MELNKLIESFKSVAIVGRMAYSIKCLEKSIEKENIHISTILSDLIDKLWVYVSTSNLSNWQREVDEICPESIFDEKTNFTDFEFIDFDKANSFLELYKTLPDYIVEMIDEVIMVGTSNLYAGLGEYAHLSHYHLSNVITLCSKNEVDLPETLNFLKIKFSENGGWGNTYPKEHFGNVVK